VTPGGTDGLEPPPPIQDDAPAAGRNRADRTERHNAPTIWSADPLQPARTVDHERSPSPLAGGSGGAQASLTLEEFLPRSAWHAHGLFRHGARCVRAGREADYGPTRELCEGCPVGQECLEVALADPDLFGLWGNTTEAERRERWRNK